MTVTLSSTRASIRQPLADVSGRTLEGIERELAPDLEPGRPGLGSNVSSWLLVEVEQDTRSPARTGRRSR